MEDYKYKSLPKMFRVDPDSVKYSMFEQARDSIGPYGIDRVNYIKKQFDKIFKNILPYEYSCCLFLFDNIQMHRYIKIQTGEIRKKYADYICKDKEMFDRILDMKFSERALNFFRNNGKENLKLVHDVRKWIRKLVYVRNKLLCSMKTLHYFKDSGGNARVLYPFTKEDHTNLTEKFMALKDDSYLDHFHLYKIDKKKEEGEYTSEIELSD